MDNLDQIKQKQLVRYWLLKKIYEKASGSTENAFEYDPFLQELVEIKKNFPPEEISPALGYLQEEKLITFPYSKALTITHRGVKEFEDSVLTPNQPTEHFPLVDIRTVNELYLGDNRSGDVYQDISNSNIVNKSSLKNSFNTLERQGKEETLKVLEAILEEVKNSGNKDAEEHFEAFSEELSKDMPRKSLLKSLWSSMVRFLPSLAQMTTVVKFLEENLLN